MFELVVTVPAFFVQVDSGGKAFPKGWVANAGHCCGRVRLCIIVCTLFQAVVGS